MYRSNEFGGNVGAYDTIKTIGTHIKEVLKPKFIVCLSGHWELNVLSPIEISVPSTASKENKLIYDFYGFPLHMYKETFRSRGSEEVAKTVQQQLQANGLKASTVTRGIDHGVWVPFKVAFGGTDDAWDIDVPVVQVSLVRKNDFKVHYELGKALAGLREQGALIIGSGMSVHNLRDLGASKTSYTKPFNTILTEILSQTEEARLESFNKLLTSEILYQAHPTLEHLMPAIVAAGAAYSQPAKEVYNAASGSLGWGIYQFD